MSGPVLRLQGFGVCLGDRVILTDVTVDLPATGMTVLVGPAGCGKSTLLRTLAGFNSAHPSLRTWGTARFRGRELECIGSVAADADRPSLVMQGARFFIDSVRENLASALPNRSALERAAQARAIEEHLEACGLAPLADVLDTEVIALPLPVQRLLALARALMSDPRLLLVDELEVGLEDDEARQVLDVLLAQAARRAVLVVTHNQRFARRAGGTTVLLAGGRVQEEAPTATFFTAPTTPAGQAFVRTGGCVVPEGEASDPAGGSSPGETEAAPAASGPSRFLGPRGFYWARHGSLGGTPRPGIIDRLELDLDGLRRLGVSLLVTLEESRTVAPEDLSAYGIRSVHFPIADMGAPALAPALALCSAVDRWMQEGQVVAFHCRAGLGRTGLMLACQLIYGGDTARGALDAIRAINARYIQSDEQVDFLRLFESTVRHSAVRGAPDGAPVVG